MSTYRGNEIYVSDEVLTYLRIKAKSIGGGMTADQLCDCLCREKLTTDDPALVVYWDKRQELQQASKKVYVSLEEEVVRQLVSPSDKSRDVGGEEHEGICATR